MTWFRMYPVKPWTARFLSVITAGICVVAVTSLHAQTRTSLSVTKYADPLLRTGTLPNGLRYYVRQNAIPVGRAELRLVVDAGSILEDDDQRGLAHFVEHMAFNGTTRFPKHRLIDYLESIGMSFGNDLNASTSYDETVYMLTVPTDRVILDTALMILEDWVQHVSFDLEEIEAERGVVMEERRMRNGPQLIQYQKHAPVLLGNRYASRLPIGTGYVLTTAPKSAFVRFYKDWYRPDLMTVVVVGDFDPVAMEATIKERFGKIPKAVSPRPRPNVEVPSWNTAMASIAEDDAGASYSAQLIVPLSVRDTGWSPDAVRRRAIATLFYQVLNDRLRVLARAEGSPIRTASVSQTTLGRDKAVHAVQLEAEEPTTLELGIIAVRAEIGRLARDGVLPGEFELSRAALIETATAARLKSDARSSGELAQRYVTSALERKLRPSSRVEAELLLEYLPGLTPADLQALAHEMESAPGWLVLADVPKNSAYGTITSTMLLEALHSGERHRLPQYRDTTLASTLTRETLLANKPAGGHVVQRRILTDIGVTEWTLDNGARVILKPASWGKDEITIRAVSPGGISLASDADYLNAAVAGSLVSQSGLGIYDARTLARRIVGKVGQWGVDIDPYEHAITVAGSPRHAGAVFEILHLAFTSPRIDKEVFDKWRRNARRNYPSGFDFQQQRVLAQRHPRARPVAGAAVDSVDSAAILNFYKSRFADAGQFTFVIVGDFEPDSLRPLIEQYIGGLPGTGTHTALQARDPGIRPPGGVVRRTVVGDDTLSKTLMTFTAETAVTPESNVTMQALTSILRRRLFVRMREELGGTYGVRVRGEASMVPYGLERLSIEFSSKPERVEELQQAALAVIDTIISNGITPDELAYTQRMLLRRREIEAQSNSYWMMLLTQMVTQGQTLEAIATEQQQLHAVTTESIHAAIRRVLTRERYMIVMELPVRLAPAERDELSTEW